MLGCSGPRAPSACAPHCRAATSGDEARALGKAGKASVYTDMLESYTCRPSSSACREGLAIRQTHGSEHTQHQLLIRKGYRGFLEIGGGGGEQKPLLLHVCRCEGQPWPKLQGNFRDNLIRALGTGSHLELGRWRAGQRLSKREAARSWEAAERVQEAPWTQSWLPPGSRAPAARPAARGRTNSPSPRLEASWGRVTEPPPLWAVPGAEPVAGEASPSPPLPRTWGKQVGVG